MRIRSITTAGMLVVSLISVTAIQSGTVASAAPGLTVGHRTVVKTVALHATAFDPAVAAAHHVTYQRSGNNLVLTLPGGKIVRYSLGSASAGTTTGVTPYNTVEGNCGTSTYEIYNLDEGGWAMIYYGFDLTTPAISYFAAAYASNDWTDDAFHDHHMGDLAMRKHWGHDWWVHTGSGEVSGGAFLSARLWYGVTCTSVGPKDEHYIS